MITHSSQVKPLEEILAYQNQEVLDRFAKMRPEAKDEAELIFDDVKRFLWLVATSEEKRKAGADLPDISFSENMLIMDEMWHAFILYTEYYADFCDKYLGQFIHHPTAMDRYQANSKEMSEAEASQIFVRELAEMVYDIFDEATAVRWFDYYSKYPVN